jgi:nickel/cobalt exporter
MRRGSRLISLAPALVVLLSTPALVAAHPLGNFTINHYAEIRVAPNRIQLDVVVDMAEIPTVTELPLLDTDGDGSVRPAELDAQRVARCRQLVAFLTLTVDGRPIAPTITEAGLALRPGEAGLDTLRTTCGAEAILRDPIATATEIAFSDRSWIERSGWREVVVSGDRVRAVATDALAATASERLLAYPDERLTRPLAIHDVTIMATPGGPPLPALDIPDATPIDAAQVPAVVAPPSSGDPLTGLLEGLVAQPDAPPLVIGLALLVAVVVGAGHALSPGHGKTMMAAYLVGSSGRPRDAALLGLVVTASHTIGVVGLAALTLIAGRLVPPERLYPVLGAVAGAAVVGIGTWMLATRLLSMARSRSEASHGHEHPHVHPHPHGEHEHPSTTIAGRPGRRALIGLGLAGGLVPSAPAVLLLLGAVASGRPLFGLGLAIAFGMGMAIVLCAIGIGIVRAGALVGRTRRLAPLAAHAGTVAAWAAPVVIIAAGGLFLGQALTASV